MTESEMIDGLKHTGIPALHLVAANEGASSVSKIGGLPDVPHPFAWPSWHGEPLAFLAQIDLSTLMAMPSLPGLPAAGILYFFYNQEQSTWGFDPADRGSWRVIHLPHAQQLTRAMPPDELSEDYIYTEKRIAPKPIQSFPSLERMGLNSGMDTDDIYEALEALRTQETKGGPEHQIGGFPSPVQGDSMELECQLASNGLYVGNASGYNSPQAAALAPGASAWKLLLQLDGDDDTGMMWGDCGILYFWIRTQDLLAANFANVWMILQCS